MTYLLDANVATYAAGKGHPRRTACLEILDRIARGSVRAALDCEVLQEILYRFAGTGRAEDGYRLFDRIVRIVPLVLPVEPEEMRKARALLESHPALTPRDAVHAAITLRRDLRGVLSYDRDLDAVPGLRRVEPEDLLGG